MSTIWDHVPPPSTPDSHSREAAERIKGVAFTIRNEVLLTIARRGPIAEWEIERILDLPGNTVRPRVWELMKQGAILRTDERGTTPSGRSCYLYVVDHGTVL